MARRAPRGDEPRTATLTVRLTEAERALVMQRAASANMTPSAYIAETIRTGRVVVEQRELLAPPLMVELSRIGNNLNQLAHGMNAGYSPASREVVNAASELLTFLMRQEIIARRAEGFAPSGGGNDSTTSRARDQFQGRVGLPSPR